MSLHDRISELAVKRKFEFTYEQQGYCSACKDASLLAKEADELMAEMAEILDCCGMGMVCHNRARAMVNKYNAYKESTK